MKRARELYGELWKEISEVIRETDLEPDVHLDHARKVIRKVERRMGLSALGYGSGRSTWPLDEKYVLKVSWSGDESNEQNKNEIAAWKTTDLPGHEHLVPVLVADRRGRWLVMPRLRKVHEKPPPSVRTPLWKIGFWDTHAIDNWGQDEQGAFKLLDYGSMTQDLEARVGR